MVMRNAAIFYAYSAVIITLLLWAARRNRKTGWRRKRIQPEWLPGLRLPVDYPLPPAAVSSAPVDPERLRAQLLALGKALAASEQAQPSSYPSTARPASNAALPQANQQQA